MPFDYQVAARAMQRAASLPREVFVSKPADLPPASRHTLTPYIGWIGPDYRGGTVIVGKDPGGPKELHEGTGATASHSGRFQVRDWKLDARLEAELLALPTALDAEIAMRSISTVFLAQMPYNGMRRILAQISERLNEPVEAMAFFNLCPYRTHGPSYIKGLREIAVHLVPALSAHTVLILNSPVAKDLLKVGDGTLGATWPPLIVFRRPQDAQGLHDVGLRALEDLARNPEWRLQRGKTVA